MGEARHALIVAASKYRDARLPPLGAPGEDARNLRDVLRNAEIGGFEVQLALNSRVQALRRTLEAFFAKRARDDLLFVHFSGHGLKDDEGQLYLAAADTEVDLLRATALDTEWLRQLMNDCRSEKIAVFLDCCFGGAFATTMTQKVGVDAPGIKEHLGGAGRVVITASNAVQYAFEGGTMVGAPEASVFTEALVLGLNSGEADRNEDGKVTINELFEYLRDKVRERSPNQTPMKWEFNAEGDWEIATSRRASIKLLSPELQAMIASFEIVPRLAAIAELGSLLESPDQRIRESALLAVQVLTSDDSDKIKAAAKRVLALANANATRQAEAQRKREAEAEAKRQREAQRQRELEAEAQRQRELEAEAQRQRELEAEAQRQRELEAEAQRQRDAEAEAQRQRDAEAEAQRQRDAEAEAQRQRDAEAEAQRQRDAEAEAQRQRDAEAEAQRQRDAEAEAQRQRDAEAEAQRQRDAEAEAQRQRDAEAEAQRQRDAEAEAQRQREIALEAERQRKIAALEAERRRKIAVGVGGGVIGLGLLAAVAWVGCVGRDCGPSASPSGGSIAIASTGPGESPSGSVPADSGGVVVAPPGTLVFSVLVNDLPGTTADDYDIWAAASDGSDQRPIVTAPGRQTDPAWSPDGSEIAYADATSGIRIVTVTGESADRFTKVTGDLNPIWAADGTIAFTRTTSKGNLDIYILGRDDPGSDPTQLTTSADSDWDPSWSPAGDQIAFASDRVSPKAIFTMDKDGAHQLQRTFDGGYYDDPAWSPRNDWIAATRADEEGGKKSIWLIPLEGGDPHRLTEADASESDPTWSDDGRELAFARAGEVVIVDLDGNTLRSFAGSGGRIVWPEWH